MRSILAVSFAGLLCACAPKSPEPPKPQAGGVIPQAQLDALNKAKGVENTLLQGEQQRQAQLDQ